MTWWARTTRSTRTSCGPPFSSRSTSRARSRWRVAAARFDWSPRAAPSSRRCRRSRSSGASRSSWCAASSASWPRQIASAFTPSTLCPAHVHAIDATPRAGKLRFRIQDKVAAALSASPRLTPSPDKAVEAAKEQGWNAADLVEVYLWGQDDSSDDDDDVDPDGPRILGLLHRGDLCKLKADDKVIVKVVSVGRRKVDVTFVNWHEGMTKSVKPSELVPMNLDEGRQPRRHPGRLAVGARLVRVSCMDGFHDGVVRSVEQFGYEVRFADGDEGFVSLKQAHEAAARALEKKRSAEESSSSSKPAAKKRK